MSEKRGWLGTALSTFGTQLTGTSLVHKFAAKLRRAQFRTGGKYLPHQGRGECARRRLQRNKGVLK